MDDKLSEEFQRARNSVDCIVDGLVNNVLNICDTYEDAVKTVSKLKYELAGNLGKIIIDSCILKIEIKAMKKATEKVAKN